MSVAFRRESDEEHKEPKFELPIPAGPNLVTARGLHQINKKVASLETDIADCKDDTRREMLRRDLRYWHTRQTTAQLAPLPLTDTVAFGTRVDVVMKGNLRTLDIVGSDEADPDSDRIAFTAPLARAIMGAETGDLYEFGAQSIEIEIVAIATIPGE
jgi:transcription elongation GreA/GreB family factor